MKITKQQLNKFIEALIKEQFEWTEDELSSFGNEEEYDQSWDVGHDLGAGDDGLDGLDGLDGDDGSGDEDFEDEYIGRADGQERFVQEAKKKREALAKQQLNKLIQKVIKEHNTQVDPVLQKARESLVGKRFLFGKDKDVATIKQVTKDSRTNKMMAWFDYERVQVHSGWVWVDKLRGKLLEQRQDFDPAFRGAGLPRGAQQFDQTGQAAELAEDLAKDTVKGLKVRLRSVRKQLSPQQEQKLMEGIYQVLFQIFKS